jgi:hypothetical protein
VLHVLTTEPPTRRNVRTIRNYGPVADGRALVAGQTASDLDPTDFVLSRAPHAIGVVVSVTLIVLFLLLRSVVWPIKAV